MENSEKFENLDFQSTDLQKICRICLKSDQKLHSIFEDLKLTENIPLETMIAECGSYVVHIDDNHPKNICILCIKRLIAAYNFRKQCRKSYQIISLLHKNVQISIDSIVKQEIEPFSTDNFTQTEQFNYLQCEKCTEKCSTQDELEKHLEENNHHDCPECKKSFRKIGFLKNHISTCHPEIDILNLTTCPLCHKNFTRPEQLRGHLIKIHHKKFLFGQFINKVDTDQENQSIEHVCAICSTVYETNEELSQHKCILKIEEKIEKNDNNMCIDNEDLPIPDSSRDCEDEDSIPIPFKFLEPIINTSIIEEFTKDIPTHPTKKHKKEIKMEAVVKPDKTCLTCNKSFKRQSHLRRHELTHLNLTPFDCSFCNKKFSRTDHLNNHISKMHSDLLPHKCEYCGRGFSEPDNYEKHIKKCKLESTKICTEQPKRSFLCTVCNKSFTTEKYFKHHVKSHGLKAWTCKYCPVVSNSKLEAKEHQKTHPENERPYLCSECGLRFVRNDYLTIHMRRHNGEKPYKCKFCDKGFPRATDLNVHERYHTGEKSHLCVICGKGFQRAYNLVVHMRVHTGERPYKCPHCPKSFAQGNDLKSHIRRHTGERFRCEICNQGFVQGYHLTQHRKNSHGIDVTSHIRRLNKTTPIPKTTELKIQKLVIQLVDENGTVNKCPTKYEESIQSTNYDEEVIELENIEDKHDISSSINSIFDATDPLNITG